MLLQLNKSPLETLKEQLSYYGAVTCVCEGNKFTLRVQVYDLENNYLVTDMISELFQSLGVSFSIGTVRKNIVCSWEIRRR